MRVSVLALVAVVFAVAFSGCAGQPATLHRDGTVVPAMAPVATRIPTGIVVAAIINQTSGGIAAFESGVSAVFLFDDGTVLRLEGHPWGPRDRAGACADAIQQALMAANRSVPRERAIECTRDMVANAQMGSMPSEAMAEIRAYLDGLGPFAVPAWRQLNDCCDRVYTTRYLFLDGAHDTVIDEQSSGDPAPVGSPADDFMAEMAALGAWVKGP